MKIISDIEFAQFLTKMPLYRKIKAVTDVKSLAYNAYLFEDNLDSKAFKFECPSEREMQTFKTKVQKDGPRFFGSTIERDEDELPLSFDTSTERLDCIVHIKGVCQSCGYQIDFLVKLWSDKEWSKREEGLTIYLQKVGQFPSYEIEMDRDLKKYLTQEDQESYSRALICLSNSYGIGAYAYFRRIIENEIKRIIQDISELDFIGVENVKSALEIYRKDFQMAKLIDVVNKYLPTSLKELGDNPIRLLYEQLSGGIHEFTDEQCMEKAASIDVLLKFVIKKIREDKYQLGDVKQAMQQLRNGKV